MKTSFRKLFWSAVLLSFVWVGGWWFGRGPAREDVHVDESLAPSQSLVADSLSEVEQDSLPVKSNRMPVPEPAPMAMVLPPEDLDEAREWTRQSLSEALAWLMNAPAGEQRDAVAEIVCASAAQSDPAHAVSLAERFSGGNSNLLENLLQQWADQNEPAAYAYAISQPAGDERNRLLSRVALARSRENPVGAAKLVAEQIAPGEVQNEAAISVLHQWALRDPDAALGWAQLFPEESIRNRALKEVEIMFPEQPE